MDPFVRRPKLPSAVLEFRDPCWRPAVDVYRDGDAWLCKFDLAGVAAEDVEVTVRGHLLTVAGVRRDRTVRAGLRAYSLEIAYHRFERTLELPCRLEDATISCSFRDGMLLVAIGDCGERAVEGR
jgi:HSP20 family protein